MELEELKAGWNVLNERLAQNEILNKRIIKDMIVTRTNSALSRLKWMNWGGIILVFVMFILVLIMKNCGYSSGSNDYFRIAGGERSYLLYLLFPFSGAFGFE